MSKEITHVDWFGGIGGFSHGFEQAGIRTVAYSEIEPFACAVFDSRHAGVPNLGCVQGIAEGWPHLDIRKDDEWVCPAEHAAQFSVPGEWQNATIWTAGTPCQDVSVAGQRRGLHDEDGDLTRSGLALTFLDLVREHRPSWVIIENVPGLLSSNKGRDLAVILDSLAESGYGWAYRILDARFFSVAQRRRRIFIVATCDPGGDIGARRAAEVLSIGQSGTGHPATGDEARTGTPEGVARSLTASSWKRHDEDTDTLVERIGRVGTLPAALGHHGYTLGQEVHQGHILRDLTRYPLPESKPIIPALAPTLNSGGNDGGFRTEPGAHLVAFRKSARMNADPNSPETCEPGIVRRLTPTEAELLQGFPLGYTIPDPARWKYEPDPDYPLLPRGLDSARYRVLGNAVCANVTEWLGHRLASMIASEQEQAA